MDIQPGTGGTPAASPPAPVDVSAYMRDADSRDRGTAPEPTPSADSSPASLGDAPLKAQADPPPADPTKKTRNRETRIAELDAENAELQRRLEVRRTLREELATLERTAKPTPASDPAQPQPKATWERYKHLPDAPKVEDFDAYEDYLDARAEFIAEKHYEAREQRRRLDAESRDRMTATEKRISTFTERLAKARETDADFDTKVHPDLLTKIEPAFAMAPGATPRAANVLLQEIVDSDASADLLVHFSTDEGRAEWNRLVNAETPAAMIRHFGRVEARFLSSGTPAAADKAPAPSITKAPAPPTVFGTRPPVSPDRLAAAVAKGDVGAFMSAADAADLKRARG